ncbi:MAG: lysylphosphatidylglycerol synthase transmembrane domain-containing protein [Candidatus Micrarchaeaceae archaeon]
MKERIKKAESAVLLSIFLSLMVFVGLIIITIKKSGLYALETAFIDAKIGYVFLGFASVVLSYIILFPKWHLFSKQLMLNLKPLQSMVIYLSMYSMDFTPGRWGRSVSLYTIKKITGRSMSTTFPLIVADVFTDFFSISIVGVFLALLLRKYAIISLILTFILLVPFVFLFYEKPFLFLKKRSKNRIINILVRHGERYFYNKKLLKKSAYIEAFAFTIPFVLLNGLSILFFMRAFGPNPSFSFLVETTFVFCFSMMVGALSSIPDGLGVVDAAMITYLGIFFYGNGVSFAIISAITILFRIASIWVIQGIGFILLIYSSKKYWLPRVSNVLPQKS